MSAVASFALECARSGRWARGMLALRPSLPARDPQTRYAALTLALAAAPHDAGAAMGLLTGHYAVEHNDLVGDALNTIARNPQVSSAALSAVALPLLREAVRADAAAAGRLFLSATAWVGADTAERLFEPLTASSLSVAAGSERLSQLRRCKEEGEAAYSFYFPDWLPPVDVHRTANERDAAERAQVTRHHTARDRRERARLKMLMAREASAKVREEEQRQMVAAFDELPPWWSVATMLRMATRPPAATPAAEDSTPLRVSWRTALTILGEQRLLPELELPYTRCVGLCAPSMWEEAIHRLGEVLAAPEGGVGSPPLASATPSAADEARRRARLWLVSRGSGAAAAAVARSYLQEAEAWASAGVPRGESVLQQRRQWAEELLARTLVDRSDFFALFPAPHRPLLSVGREQPCAAIACALATGVRLDNVQLSAPVKEWTRQGDWVSVLAVYYRFPTPEFQRRAVEALIAFVAGAEASGEPRGTTQCGGSAASRFPGVKGTLPKPPQTLRDVLYSVLQVPSLKHVRREVSLGTHAASLLIRACKTGEEAVSMLRLCVRHGTVCNPQLLSAVMDKRPSRRDVGTLLKGYPAAVNEGVARRAREDFDIVAQPHVVRGQGNPDTQ